MCWISREPVRSKPGPWGDQELVDWARAFAAQTERLTQADRCRHALDSAEACAGVDLSADD